MKKNDIIEAVRSAIEQQRLTRYQLAKKSGLRESTLQRLDSPEWGQQIETLCRIAEAVGMEVTIKKR